MKYNEDIVKSVMISEGIPEPVFELKFHPTRRWRFDLAWPDQKLALEVNGGDWAGGAHVRPAALTGDYEKRTAAAMMGWRIMVCRPNNLLMNDMIQNIKTALDFS